MKFVHAGFADTQAITAFLAKGCELMGRDIGVAGFEGDKRTKA